MNLKSELEAVVDALSKDGVGFALCGGIAVTVHGAPRFTKDIDLLIRQAELAAALAAARTVGFDLAAAPMCFDAGGPRERTIHRVSKVEGDQVLTLDLLLVEPAFNEVWNSRVWVEWEGRRVPVVSKAGLVQMKRLAGRDQDLVDIKSLESGSSDGG